MQYLLEDLPRIAESVSAGGVFLLLDYDGTLVEMAPSPELATMDESRRDVLRQLAKCSRCRVAVISGRDLDDIKKMVGADGLFYSGSHGLELDGPEVSYRHPVKSEYTAVLQKMANQMTRLLADFKGVMIERKKFSLCVHYRLCQSDQVSVVRHIVTEAIIPLVANGDVKVLAGRKSIEILPPYDWDKGRMVLWLLQEYGRIHPSDGLLPVFIGDDITDEMAFDAIAEKGLTVFVGEHRESRATYFLKNVQQVYEFLGHLVHWLGREAE